MTTTLPKNISFTSRIDIQAALDDKSPSTFSMLAYTGGPMLVEGFDLPVVVDLSGLMIKRQSLPVRLDHDAARGVGHTTSILVDNGKLSAQGVISRDTGWARDVANSGKRGFPWQVSIGAGVLKYEYLQPDAVQIVNGQEISGDCYIIRSSVLKELSFVDAGADDSTYAQITANNNHKGDMVSMPKSKEDKKEVNACDCNGSGTCTSCTAQNTPAVNVETKTSAPQHIQAAEMPDVIADMRAKAAAESQRIADIRAVCKGQHADIEAKAIGEGWDTTKTELEVLRASRPKAPTGFVRTSNNNAAVLEASALMTSGEFSLASLEKHFDEKTLDAADRLRGIGIQELADLACGQHLPKFRSDPAAWLQAAFSTTSLPGILSNVAHKMLLEGFNLTDQTWRSICRIASVSDFKEHTRYRLTSDFKFEKVGPDGELKHGRLGEEQFGNKADTHGIMFALTRQMIINDDLGAFAEIPRLIGMGAGDAINDAVWPLLLSLVGTGFFSTANKNYKTGADTALSIDSLSAARQLFRKQSKPGKNGKRPLGIMPQILLVPTSLEDYAVQLMTSKEVLVTTAEGVPTPKTNPQAGRYKVISTEYIGGEFLDNGSDKAWYLFADPRILAALEVAFLNGKDSPTVERADADFNTLGVQFRGYIDFGTRQQDNRAAVLMKGQA